MRKYLTGGILVSILTVIVVFFTGCPTEEPKYDYKYFSKRRWCPTKQVNMHSKAIQHSDEKKMKNYYKVSYYKGSKQIASSTVFKNMKKPAGNWYYYHKNGQIEKEMVHKKGKLDELYEYKYNKDNEKTTYSHYIFSKNANKLLRVQSRYFYDSYKECNKRLTGKVENYNGAILDEIIKYDYDNKCRLSKKSVYLFNNQLNGYNLYHYNSDNLLVKEEIYNRENIMTYFIVYEYYPSKLLKDYKMHRIEQGNKNKPAKPILLRRKTYIYDKDGKLTKESEYDTVDNILEKVSHREYKYDKHGCIVCKKIYNSSGILMEKVCH